MFSDLLPMFIELRRVTGCTPKRLRAGFVHMWSVLGDLGQMPAGQVRDGADLPAVTTLQNAFVEAGLEAENESPTGFRDRPGWFALHVARAITGGGEMCELAMFWEPFSRLLFARLEPTFNPFANDALADFVSSSLNSLPSELKRLLQSILVTTPVSAASDGEFWYSRRCASNRGEGAGVTTWDEHLARVLRPLVPDLRIANAPESEDCAPVDFRPFMGDLDRAGAGGRLRQWQNAYNLRHPKRTDTSAQPPPLRVLAVHGNWGDADFSGRRCFFEGYMLTLPPQQRLEWSLEDGGARSSLTALRATLHR